MIYSYFMLFLGDNGWVFHTSIIVSSNFKKKKVEIEIDGTKKTRKRIECNLQ